MALDSSEAGTKRKNPKKGEKNKTLQKYCWRKENYKTEEIIIKTKDLGCFVSIIYILYMFCLHQFVHVLDRLSSKTFPLGGFS